MDCTICTICTVCTEAVFYCFFGVGQWEIFFYQTNYGYCMKGLSLGEDNGVKNGAKSVKSPIFGGEKGIRLVETMYMMANIICDKILFRM